MPFHGTAIFMPRAKRKAAKPVELDGFPKFNAGGDAGARKVSIAAAACPPSSDSPSG